GAVDGIWGPGSISAVQRFNLGALASIDTAMPSQKSIEAVAAQKRTVCAAPQPVAQPTRTVSPRPAQRPQSASRPSRPPQDEPSGGGGGVIFGGGGRGGGGGLTIGIGGGGFRF
ncbi:MAG: hypothetical protein AB7O70_01615, partial [Hyphomicrobiales bacterium]